MTGEEMYKWFEQEVQAKVAGAGDKFSFSYEPTVTTGVYLGKISLPNSHNRPIVKADVRPEGVRLHFPVAWADELSAWLGTPPADAYRLKSDWVRLPSIGVATHEYDPYFINLTNKIIEMLQK